MFASCESVNLIHANLNLAEVSCSRRIEAQYSRLKEEYFDEQKDLWQLKDKNDKGTWSFINDQFCSVLARSCFDRNGAERQLAALRTSPFLNKRRELWKGALSPNGRVSNGVSEIEDQLLGIVAEGVLNPNRAADRYEMLKRNKLWTHKVAPDSDLAFLVSSRPTAELFLRVLVESRYDMDAGRSLYEAIESSGLRNDEIGLWPDDEERICYSTCTQLFAVAAESLFHPQRAAASYEELKASLLWDGQRHLWHPWDKREELAPEIEFFSTEQLLGLYVEFMLYGGASSGGGAHDLPPRRTF